MCNRRGRAAARLDAWPDRRKLSLGADSGGGVVAVSVVANLPVASQAASQSVSQSLSQRVCVRDWKVADDIRRFIDDDGPTTTRVKSALDASALLFT